VDRLLNRHKGGYSLLSVCRSGLPYLCRVCAEGDRAVAGFAEQCLHPRRCTAPVVLLPGSNHARWTTPGSWTRLPGCRSTPGAGDPPGITPLARAGASCAITHSRCSRTRLLSQALFEVAAVAAELDDVTLVGWVLERRACEPPLSSPEPSRCATLPQRQPPGAVAC